MSYKPDIEVGDMIKDPKDGSLGIVIADMEDIQRYQIYWFALYDGITKECYRDFNYDMGFDSYYKIS